MTKKIIEKIDITEAICEYSIAELIAVLKVLNQNGYTELYFDGYNASVEALKKE